MYIYKFRLLYDEIEGFVRDYEIGAKQTFKDFHDIILQSIKGLDPKSWHPSTSVTANGTN